MLSDLARVAACDGKRFRGQVPLMDRIPDTAQPDHAQVQDDLPANDRPRHPRAFEPLRKDDLASGLRNTRAARKLLALVAVVTHPLRACFDVTIGLLVELGLATKPPMPTQRHGIFATVIGASVYLPGGATSPGFAATRVNEVFEVQ